MSDTGLKYNKNIAQISFGIWSNYHNISNFILPVTL